MCRYIGLIWNADNPAQSSDVERYSRRVLASSARWQAVFDGPGLRVFQLGPSPSSSRVLPDHAGVIVGSLFEWPKEGVSKSARIRPEQGTRIVASGGRALTQECWGNYTAFIHDVKTRTTWTLRGPVSHLPCLRVTSQSGVQVFGSLVPDLQTACLDSVSINWEFITAHIVLPGRTGRTGLQEVSELDGGECIETIEKKVSRHRYWDAEHIASTDLIEDRERAARGLREIIRACVQAHASEHRAILHQTSGGLDSAIVLGCLRGSGPQVICMNHYSNGPGEDERRYARDAAERAGVKLVEWRRDPRFPLERTLEAPLAERPGPYHRRLETAALERSLAAEHGASGISTGEGGDHILCSVRFASTAVDFARLHPFHPALLGISWDAAHADGLSLWQVLAAVMRRSWGSHQCSPAAEALSQRRLLTAQVTELLGRHDHARELTRRVPEGKQHHVKAAVAPWTIFNCLDPFSGLVELTPLISQPIVEWCLRIPTYVLVAHRRNRDLARYAFVDDLPASIVHRRGKATLGRHFNEIVVHNLPFLRALLLDGELVRQGLIDRRRTEEVLSPRPSSLLTGMWELVAYLMAETWAQTVIRSARRAAA